MKSTNGTFSPSMRKKTVTVREVSTPADLRLFIDLPFRIYRDCPYWIPPIKKAEAAFFNPEKNPAFHHSKVKLWIAEKNGQVAGRVVGIINDLETEYRGTSRGRFGWLEFEDDRDVSGALLEAACEWAHENGCKWIKGPVGFSYLDPAGLTIEGFEEVGTVSDPFHYPYYGKHLDQLGFQKMNDYFEYVVDKVPTEIPEKLKKLGPVIEKRYGIRPVAIRNGAELKEMIDRFFGLLPASFKDLPTYVPLSEEEKRKYISDFLPFMRPEYMPLLMDREGNVAGFGLIIPSFSHALIKAKGRLFPFGFLHLLWNRKFHREADLVMVGVLQKWRGKGLNALIFSQAISQLIKQRVKKVRLYHQLEENQAAHAIFKDYHPRLFRKRRVYWKELAH